MEDRCAKSPSPYDDDDHEGKAAKGDFLAEDEVDRAAAAEAAKDDVEPKRNILLKARPKSVAAPRAASASAAGQQGKTASRRHRRRLASMAARLRSNPHAPSVAPEPGPGAVKKAVTLMKATPKRRSRMAAAIKANEAAQEPIERPTPLPRRRKRDARPHAKREVEDPADVDEDALLMRPGYDDANLQRFLTRRLVHDSRALRVLSQGGAPEVSMPRSVGAPRSDSEQAPRSKRGRRR